MIRGGQLMRRVPPNEKIRTMVVGRWLQWDAQDCYLVFKKDPMPPIHISVRLKQSHL